MTIMQDILDLSRFDLNDPLTIVTASGTSTTVPRSTDDELLKFANDGIAKALVLRPDLYFGQWLTPYTDLTSTSTFPLPIEYRPAIVSYVVARQQSGDDEFVIEQRADKSMTEFMKNLGAG